MRGAAFLWSPLLRPSGYVSDYLMSVSDWLPTLLHAAGYDMSRLPAAVDGIDLWDAVSRRGRSVRDTLLHNIDPVGSAASAAIRVHDWKLIEGVGGYPAWDGWYPLPGGDAGGAEGGGEGLGRVLRSIGRRPVPGSPVVVRCGAPPTNATACRRRRRSSVCLFNIADDPCEYHDLADRHPGVVRDLRDMIDLYRATAVAPRNKPMDPAGWPSRHGGAWQPWVNLTETPHRKV